MQKMLVAFIIIFMTNTVERELGQKMLIKYPHSVPLLIVVLCRYLNPLLGCFVLTTCLTRIKTTGCVGFLCEFAERYGGDASTGGSAVIHHVGGAVGGAS